MKQLERNRRGRSGGDAEMPSLDSLLRAGSYAAFYDRNGAERVMQVEEVHRDHIVVIDPVERSEKGRYLRHTVWLDNGGLSKVGYRRNRLLGRYDRRHRTTFYFRLSDAERILGEPDPQLPQTQQDAIRRAVERAKDKRASQSFKDEDDEIAAPCCNIKGDEETGEALHGD